MNKVHTILTRYYSAATLIVCCFFLSACENDQKQIDLWTKKVTEVEEAKQIESYLSQDGIMRAKLTAPLMLRVLTDTLYVEFPNSLHVDFYNDSTKVESWLDSKYGKYFESLDKVYLRDSVVVINIKGDTLKCPDLWWDQNTKLFYTDKYAEYHAKGKNIYGGKGMEATQDMKSVTFKEPTGIVNVSDKGMVE
ncbi:MAG: LPS export ABC transporter periplasmic protein LptC [Chitinophagaceae bacterium]|nr:LPS export ABC transporter periplasmic protein LptC [Chitinophagaceae bacterium]